MTIKSPSLKNKVCHVTSAHSRYDVRIFHKECKSLAKHGFDVTLLVNDDLEDELVDGIKIISTHFKPKNRFERMIISQRKIKHKAVEIDAEIYHFHDPELLPLASYLKRKNKKVIFDFHEDVSQQILFKEWIPKKIRKIISKIYKVYEEKHSKKFNALITVTPKFLDRLKLINKNSIMVTNYPILRSEFNSTDQPKSECICFAGGITTQWNHLNIIKAIETLDSIKYLLAGSGSSEYLDCLKNQDGWKKVDYLGRIPHEEVKSIYSKAMVGMSLLSHHTQVGMDGTLGNTKLFEYMEAGIPVICSDNKIWKEIVKKHKCGIAIDPNNVKEIRKAIVELINNPKKSKEMGENGRRAVEEEYNWKTQEEILVTIYRDLVRN